MTLNNMIIDEVLEILREMREELRLLMENLLIGWFPRKSRRWMSGELLRKRMRL